MFPKNAASPPRIAIGAVVQISDGAVQSSGCTVRILPEGGAEGDGAGTTAYSTDGVVLYTPTQAETNYSAFVLIAKKTGCIPASVTVVPTATATAGTVVVTTNNDKTGYTAATVSDKTGYSLAADQAVNVTKVNGTAQTAGDLAALIATIDGIVDTIVARVVGTIAAGTHTPQSGDAYARIGSPAGASLVADLGTATSATQAIVLNVKAKTDNLPASPAAVGSEMTLTAAYDAAKTAASAGNLATVAGYLDTEVAAILAVAQKLDGMLELDGGLYRLTVAALANAPTGASSGLDAAGVRAAIGLAAANLDAQLAGLPTDADVTAAVPSASTIASQVRTELTTELGRIDAAVTTRLASGSYTAPPSAASIASAVWGTTVDGVYTAIQLLRGMAAALIGKLSGAATATVTIRNPSDTKDVLTATVDADGNRSAVTKDLT